MTQGTEGNPIPAEPLEYARAGMTGRPSMVVAVGVISICYATLSLAINCVLLNGAGQEMHLAKAMPARLQQMIAARAQAQAAVLKAPPTLPSFRALKPLEINQALGFIDGLLTSRSRPVLTAPQRAALTTLLLKDGQMLVDPSVPLGSQTPGALQAVLVTEVNQLVRIAVNHGNALTRYGIAVDASGNVSTLSFSTPIGANFNLYQANLTNNARIFQDIYFGSLVSAIVFGVSGILAIALLVAGIYVLRSDPRGVPMHWGFAGIKAALAIVGTTSLLTFQVVSPHYLRLPLGTPLALIGFVYPAFLAVVLRGKAFRRGV